MASETRTAGGDSHTDVQKGVALLFGAVLALVGVIGFVPQLVIDDKVLGLFGITPLHNVVHLLSGVAGLLAGYYAAGGVFNKYFGLTYLLVFVVGTFGLVAGIGFITDTGTLALNIGWADNLLHLAVALVLIIVGYSFRRTSKTIP